MTQKIHVVVLLDFHISCAAPLKLYTKRLWNNATKFDNSCRAFIFVQKRENIPHHSLTANKQGEGKYIHVKSVGEKLLCGKILSFSSKYVKNVGFFPSQMFFSYTAAEPQRNCFWLPNFSENVSKNVCVVLGKVGNNINKTGTHIFFHSNIFMPIIPPPLCTRSLRKNICIGTSCDLKYQRKYNCALWNEPCFWNIFTLKKKYNRQRNRSKKITVAMHFLTCRGNTKQIMYRWTKSDHFQGYKKHR